MGYQMASEQIRTISTALIAFYRKQWLEWGISDDLGFRLDDHLHVIEFRASDCDVDELFEAFVKANEVLERKAYGCGQHHFGIGYLARRPDADGGLIRALVMVEPDDVEGFRTAAKELSDSRFGLTITKCEIDAGDPDAQWRWLAEGIIASTAMFEDSEPKFAMVGEIVSQKPCLELGQAPELSRELAIRSAAITKEGAQTFKKSGCLAEDDNSPIRSGNSGPHEPR